MTLHGTRCSEEVSRFRQYVSTNTSFNAYKEAFKAEAARLNGVNLNTAEYKNPDMSRIEATLGSRDDLMNACIIANRQYCWWFRDSKPGEPWSFDAPVDCNNFHWKATLAGSISWIEECINLRDRCDGL